MRHIVLSTLFTLKKNPVHTKVKVNEDRWGYIKDWHESLSSHQINGLVFHDGLSDEFVNEHTNEYIKFQKVPEEIYNACDARWVVYHNFIRENADKYDWVFANDISDVTIGKTFLKDVELYGKKILFTGDETATYNSGWIKDRNKDLIEVLPDVYNHIKDNPKLKVMNPGIIGGSTEIMLEYTKYMSDLVIAGGPIKRCVDMSYHNYVARTYFNDRIKHGSPVNSIFFKYQKERKDVWFIHK
jgi:hypothetical protein